MMTDRRRFGRLPFFVRVTLRPLAGSEPIEAHSFDISLAGVGLSCPSPLPVGEAVMLTFYLPTPAGKVAEELVGRIASLRFDDDAALMGVEFSSAVDPRRAPSLTRAIEGLGA